MNEEKLYKCIPELNKKCKKNNCYVNGGECEMTIYKKYTLKGLLEENQRLNNIIENMEEELMTIYLDIMEYNEDYAKREIKKLKGVDKNG